MFAIGYPLAAWVGTGVYFISASGSASTFPWRFPLALPIVFAVVLLIGSPWLPFSPRWLMSQGRYEEAEATLERLHGTKGSDEHRLDEAKKEFLQIRSQMALDQEIVQTGFFELVRTPSNRKRVLVSVLLMAGNMFTGILMLSNYGIVIFSSLGMTGAQPIILLAGVTSLGLPGNLLSAFIVDRVGRRRLLLIGISGILVSLICECTMYALYSGTTNRGGNIAGVFFLFMLVGFWGSCCDATQYLYLSEIWPNHLRSQGVAVGMFTYFCTLIIILVAAPIGLDHIGWEFFLVLIVPEAFYLVAIYL
jgi:MFS family permease